MTGKDSVKKCEDEVTDEGCLEETTQHKDDTIHGEVKSAGISASEVLKSGLNSFSVILENCLPPPYF